MIVFYYNKENALNGTLFWLRQEDKVITQEEIKEQDKEELYKINYLYRGKCAYRLSYYWGRYS